MENDAYIWIQGVPLFQTRTQVNGRVLHHLVILADYVEGWDDKQIHETICEPFDIDAEKYAIIHDGAFVWVNYMRKIQ